MGFSSPRILIDLLHDLAHSYGTIGDVKEKTYIPWRFVVFMMVACAIVAALIVLWKV